MDQELARRLVRQCWRVLAANFGEASVTAERIALHTRLPVAFVVAACELAGYPLSAAEPAFAEAA